VHKSKVNQRIRIENNAAEAAAAETRKQPLPKKIEEMGKPKLN
jgi:hypothetical protein